MKQSAKQKFLKLVEKQRYFEQHQRVLVALSGGKDSMTLFNWLYEFREKLQIELVAAHVNYGLREVADAEENQLRAKLAQLDVPLMVAHYEEATFTEEAGRKMRYGFFAEVMKKQGCTALVTAHHQDDQVETILMREITGRRLRYLTGIPERQAFAGGELIRPLLHFSKADFDATEFFDDISNHGTAYLRNRIRNQYIPAFTKENPQFSTGILALSEEISLAFSVIQEQISALNIMAEQIDLQLFDQQSPALQNFILQAYLTQFPELQLRRAKFDELLHILQRPQQYFSAISKDYFFVKSDRNFYLKKTATASSVKFDRNENLQILTENPHDPTFMRVDLPENATLEIRSRQPGDQILIHGHHKKLRKFFIENHTPLAQRENPLLLVEKKIYAIVDVACSDLSKSAKNGKMKRTLWVKTRDK